ncbi:MAG: transporter, partial [Planctomycetaceae bacterium]|nr:transporter [Planctomycetaceae bacterium]
MAEITDSEQIPAQSHPTAIYFFFWGEFAERCSYYGMRAILPLYLATSLNLSEGYPVAIYFWF